MTKVQERDDLGADSAAGVADNLRDLRLEYPTNSRTADADGETDPDGLIDLPGADLSKLPFLDEDIEPVVPVQSNEFTCRRCFLVHHLSNVAYAENDLPVCRDCV